MACIVSSTLMPLCVDGERHVPDAAGERAELHLVGNDLAGQRHGEQRAAVEAAVEGDDVAAAGMGAGDLDGVLDGLGAGRHEEGLLLARDGRQRVELLGELDEGLVGHHHEAGVGEAVELLLDAPHDRGMAMAGVEDGDAAGEIDEAAAFDVPDLGVLRRLGEDRRRHADAAGDGLRPALEKLLRKTLERRIDIHGCGSLTCLTFGAMFTSLGARGAIGFRAMGAMLGADGSTLILKADSGA